MFLRIVSAIVFLGAIVLAFLAEPSGTANMLFPMQNAVTITLAALQTLTVIGLDPFLISLLFIAWAVTAAMMHAPLAEKSPAACVMYVTATHALFERLQMHSRELKHLINKFWDRASAAIADKIQSINVLLNQ